MTTQLGESALTVVSGLMWSMGFRDVAHVSFQMSSSACCLFKNSSSGSPSLKMWLQMNTSPRKNRVRDPSHWSDRYLILPQSPSQVLPLCFASQRHSGRGHCNRKEEDIYRTNAGIFFVQGGKCPTLKRLQMCTTWWYRMKTFSNPLHSTLIFLGADNEWSMRKSSTRFVDSSSERTLLLTNMQKYNVKLLQLELLAWSFV